MTATALARRAAGVAAAFAFVAVPSARRDPYRLYRFLQRTDPVHHSPLGVVALSRHADVSAALRNPCLGVDESKADESLFHLGPFERFLTGDDQTKLDRRAGAFLPMSKRFLLFTDPPDHSRLRGLVARAFTPRVVAGLEPRIQELVDESLDRAASRGRVDLLHDIAYPLPARVICDLIGVPDDQIPSVTAAAPDIALGLDPSPLRTPEGNARADAAAGRLKELLTELVRHRRQSPGPDLLSALIEAREHEDRLTDDELIATVVLLLIAGHETTANLVTNGMLALARQPGTIQQWRDDPSLDDSAVEELLRHSGPVQITQRIALEKTEVNGQPIKKGQLTILLLASANRDPAVFTAPNRLQLDRKPNPHVALSAGPHHCLGAALARLEARVLMTGLVRRFPNLCVDTGSARWRPNFLLRGLEKLDVELSSDCGA